MLQELVCARHYGQRITETTSVSHDEVLKNSFLELQPSNYFCKALGARKTNYDI